MTPRWEKLEAPPPATEAAPLFDARLSPNRSLSRRAFVMCIVLFALVNAGVAALFIAQGAYPVAGFLAADVALLAYAFRVNYRDGRMGERVVVVDDRLWVTRRSARGAEDHWMVNPVWARVEDGPDAVRIAAGDRDVRVGAFLSPPERQSFANALRAALRRARDH